jgi:hypothetical protein
MIKLDSGAFWESGRPQVSLYTSPWSLLIYISIPPAYNFIFIQYTVKKIIVFPVPAGMSLTKLSLAGIIKLFSARESFVSDIPAGDGKNYNIFYSVQ